MCGSSSISKHVVKEHLESIFRKYADQAAAGKLVNMKIPKLGTLQCSVGLCGVIFDSHIMRATEGVTRVDSAARRVGSEKNSFNSWMY